MKYIFLDIDGTIVDSANHVPFLSPKTKHAINSLRRNGHKVFVCSGRHMPLINHQILEIEYDGFVLANGAFVYYNHEIINENTFDQNGMEKIVEVCGANDYVYYFEDIVYCYTNSIKHPLHKEFISNWPIPRCFNERFDLKDIKPHIAMLAYKDADSFKKLKDELGSYFDLTQHHRTFSCDVNIKNNNKGNGIMSLAKKLNLNKEDIIAFGDGYNDIEMLTLAGTGIAMENACDELKKVADYVTTSVADDGVYEYLLKNDYISPFEGQV